jgi:Fanconi anemia group M protein
VNLVCIDEAHRATGDYAYVGIAKQTKSQIIGFTATPGNNPDKILEVCENLLIERISLTSPTDYDVQDFISIHTPKVIWIELPEIYRDILSVLQEMQDNLLVLLKERIPDVKKSKYLGKRDALSIHQKVVSLTKHDSSFGELLISSSNLIRVQHLKELVESQGFPQVVSTLQKWKQKKSSKALRLFLDDPTIRNLTKTVESQKKVHPKLEYLVKELNKASGMDPIEDSRIIIFSNFRDTVRFLQEELTKFQINTGIFVGHSSSSTDKGLSQKEQLQVVDQFKKGEIKILISTSVGEEGLDVGNCDLVVFYDSVPSIVRSIQRQGRGRKRQSQVLHLVTKSTRDEAMYWAIKRKEKTMKTFLSTNLPELLIEKKKSRQQSTLDVFLSVSDEETEEFEDLKVTDKFSIIIDSREAFGQIPKLLKEMGANISSQKLDIGDYVLSDRLVVEYKRYSDFIRSIIDGRLFQTTSPHQESQLQRLASQEIPLLIIQSDSEEEAPSIHLNSLTGALSSILLDFGISILITHSDQETSSLLIQLAKREQIDSSFQPKIPTYTKKDQTVETIQMFMLASIPGINLKLAQELLSNFKSIAGLVDAEIDELTAIPNIGPKLATRIHQSLHRIGKEKLE